jgi:hypothetical protein
MLPEFPVFFHALWSYDPFPWQRMLAERLVEGEWPKALDLPTAAGKTACIDIAIHALAAQAEKPVWERTAPRRIWFVADRRIRGIRFQTQCDSKYQKSFFLIFEDGSAFEFRAVGYICACSRLESFDLHRLYKRGLNAYGNEVLVLKNPDGEERVVVINKLYEWPELNEGSEKK